MRQRPCLFLFVSELALALLRVRFHLPGLTHIENAPVGA